MATLLRGVPTQYEPKLVNRFFLNFPDELDIPNWLVQTAKLPSTEQTLTTIPYFNTESYVAARYKWNPIDIEFIDPIGPSTGQKIIEWFRLSAESATGRMGYAAGYVKNLSLIYADPTGVGVGKWVLYDCIISSVDWGAADYGGSELFKPKVTVQPQRCIMEA